MKNSSKIKFYSIKTVWVKWENNENSLIHELINTTVIKRFEIKKTRNEMLHLMFSSVSHELRTPINAFKNSILLIESSHQRFLSKFKEQKFSHISEELYSTHSEQTDERFFTVCKISSTCMMTLVKDILDLAKIEAGTFKLDE